MTGLQEKYCTLFNYVIIRILKILLEEATQWIIAWMNWTIRFWNC